MKALSDRAGPRDGGLEVRDIQRREINAMAKLVDRMVGAAKLDVHTYEEVEADPTTMGQAMTVVVLSSIAAGIGQGQGVWGLVVGSVAALIGWFVWALVTYVVGTKLLPQPQTEANVGQLMRTIGFAASPGLIRIAGFVPGLGWLVRAVADIWMLAAMVVAVRQALDYTSTWRAVGVCVIGWLLLIVITAVLGGMTIAALGVG
jgi:hypothetical protein